MTPPSGGGSGSADPRYASILPELPEKPGSPEPSDAAGAPAGEPWSIARVLSWTARYLSHRDLENPRLDAELLLADTLGLPRLELYLQHDRTLRPEESARYKERVRRRATGEPVQYILGYAAFRNLILRVTPAVLIPRPETERLIDELLEWVHASASAAPRLLDVGTGSGAIALSALQELPGARAVGTDVSEAALEVIASNAAAAGLADRLELRRGDLFEPLRPGESFDVIAANLPYVAIAERDALPADVREFEPATALFGGPTGLETTARLVREAPSRLVPGGLLICEISPPQAAAFRAVVDGTPGLRYIAPYRDLAGHERGFLAERIPPQPRPTP